MGGVTDSISHALGTDGSGGGLLGGISHVVQDIGHGLASVDNFVHSVIPGGWATIGAAALMAYGIYDPSLLASADAGTLTSAELSDAGYDATSIATGVSQAATDAGFTDVATYNTAMDAGFTDATTYADATLNGFSNMADYTAAQSAGVSNMAELTQAATDAGFANTSEYATALDNGFTTAAEQSTANSLGFNTAQDFSQAAQSAGFSNTSEYANALNSGYSNAAQYEIGNPQATGFGYSGPTAPEAPVAPEAPFGGTSASQLTPVQLNGEGGLLGENGQIYNMDGTLNSNLTNYYNTDIMGQPYSPVAGPGSGVPPTSIDITGLPGTVENPPPVGTVLPDGTQLATVAQQTDAINGIANGATYDEASGSWVIPKDIATAAANTGLTTTQVVALGGAAAATAAVAAGGGAGASTAFTGTTPGRTPSGTPTTTTGAPGSPTGATPGGPTAPGSPVNTPVNPAEPVTTPPGPNNPVPVHDYSTPYTMPDGTPVDTSGWSASDIAKALAGGYLLNAIAGPLLTGKYDNGYTNQYFPIPNFNQYGTVNPGVNPGFVEPAPMYQSTTPGVNQYYWGQHGYAQNMADLSNLNTNAVNAPANPYGNPNAVNLGKLITPEQLGYPSPQSLAAAQGTANPTQGNFTGLPNMSGDIYNNQVQMNTTTPQIPGYAFAYAPPTQAGMATGHGSAQQYGQSLNYNFTPAQLAELTPVPANALGT